MSWADEMIYNVRHKKFYSNSSDRGGVIKSLISSVSDVPIEGLTRTFKSVIGGDLSLNVTAKSSGFTSSATVGITYTITIYDNSGNVVGTASVTTNGDQTKGLYIEFSIKPLHEYTVKVITEVSSEIYRDKAHISLLDLRGAVIDKSERYIF